MLLLDDAEHLDLALRLKVPRRVVPPGHVPATALSPGGEDMQDQLLTAKIRHGQRPAVVHGGEEEIGKRFADLKLSG